MKRDMDLLRSFLLEVEKLPFMGENYAYQGTKVPGYSDEEICFHARLAKDKGLIEATFMPRTTRFVVQRLTFDGTEFLDAAREDSLWNKAKHKVLSNAGTLTFEAMKIALSLLMQQAAR